MKRSPLLLPHGLVRRVLVCCLAFAVLCCTVAPVFAEAGVSSQNESSASAAPEGNAEPFPDAEPSKSSESSEPPAPSDPSDPGDPDAPADFADPDAPSESSDPSETDETTGISLPDNPKDLYEAILACEDLTELERLAEAADTDEFRAWVQENLLPEEQEELARKLSVLDENENFTLINPVVAIVDTVKTDGRITLSVTDGGQSYTAEQLLAAGYSITWARNGVVVTRRQITRGVWNMDVDRQWVNVVYDKGAEATYRVSVTLENTVIGDASERIDYYDSLQNPSFESPAFSQSDVYEWPGIKQLPQESVFGWDTTAADSMIEIGNVQITGTYGSGVYAYTYFGTERWYNCGTAMDGDQIAELNCTQTGALYQDVLTEPGAQMYWRLAHRGRAGTDTMALVIAPVTMVENVRTQAQLDAFLAEHLNDPNIFVREFSDGQEWARYEGTMTVPEGQFLTRFFFMAVSTATGDRSVGNLLDDVWYSTELPPPEHETGRITVEKKIYGLDLETVRNMDPFIFDEYGDPLTFQWIERFDENDTPYVFGFTFVNDIPIYGGTVRRTFTEDLGRAQVSGYELQADSTTAEAVLTEEENEQYLLFVNTYVRNTASLTVSKLVTGALGDKTRDFAFTYSFPSGGETKSGQFTLRDGGSYTIADVPIGTQVTVLEEDCSGQRYATFYRIGTNGASQNGREAVVAVVEGGSSVTFTNYKNVIVDTGITLDSLPYILLLAAAAAGAVLLLLVRRRRNRDD